MAERKYLIKTPELSEYVFHCMMTTPKDIINNLAPHEMGFFRSPRAMRRFADNESLEKTIALFARIGIPLFIAFGNRRLLTKTFEKLPGQFDQVQYRKDIIKDMGSDKLFVVSSNELIQYGMMAAQNSHSKIYQLNADYVKIHQKISDKGKRPANEDMTDALSAVHMMAIAILQGILKMAESQTMVGLPPYQLKLLIAMFKYRHTFVSPATLAEDLNEDRRVRGVVKTCTSMEMAGFVTGLAATTKSGHAGRIYTLTEKGLKIAIDFVTNITKKAYHG